MKQKYLTRDGSARLLILFAGWAMDAAPFGTLTAPGYDMLAVWDYSKDAESPVIEGVDRYSEICVIAWSFGVPVASRFLLGQGSSLPVTLTAAVNGTNHPVDDELGIPTAIFRGTLEGLSEKSLSKFYRRMCGSKAAYDTFCERMPRRDIQELKNELEAIERLDPAGTGGARWDRVYISMDDAIIPAGNQLKAWSGHVSTEVAAGPHLPDMQGIIDASVRDKGLVGRQFGRRAATYGAEAAVQSAMALTLADMLRASVSIDGARVLEIGAGTGLFTRPLTAIGTPAELELWDISDSIAANDTPGAVKRQVDAEIAIRACKPESYDVVASSSAVQWFNSLPAFLANAWHALAPGGILAFSTFGPETFAELRRITGSSLVHYSMPQLLSLARQAGFEEVSERSEDIGMEFDSTLEMLRHIKLTGVNATRGSYAAAARAMRLYPLAEDGKAVLWYEPIYLILRKKTIAK